MIFKIKRFRISDFRLRDIEFSEVKDILKNVSILIVAALLVSSITYFDRILLFPLLGATYVSIYYASSIFGKIISQLINPMSNVLLSHLVYFEKFVKVFFIKYLVIVTIVSICMIIGINIVAPLFLRLLYPDLYVLAEEYILFGAINAALIVIYSSMNPFLLKFFSFSWQIIVNLITFIFYVLLAYILSKNYGFNGFYIGIIISNFIRVLIMLIVIFIANTKDIKNSVPKKMILNES
jgi:O-antigen/teichoic acid export membrane protein